LVLISKEPCESHLKIKKSGRSGVFLISVGKYLVRPWIVFLVVFLVFFCIFRDLKDWLRRNPSIGISHWNHLQPEICVLVS
jgi:hypothetical protein